MFIALVFAAKPLGTWSLAGVQSKVTGKWVPVLVCRACRRECAGTATDAYRFDPKESRELTEAALAAREAQIQREVVRPQVQE